MDEMPAFQTVLTIVTDDETAPGELEAAAEVVLRAVQRGAAFVALGAVASVDFARGAIEVECTLCGETPDEIHGKSVRVLDIMLEAANTFEYESSSTHRLEAALA
jgi:hypothetical protein